MLTKDIFEIKRAFLEQQRDPHDKEIVDVHDDMIFRIYQYDAKQDKWLFLHQGGFKKESIIPKEPILSRNKKSKAQYEEQLSLLREAIIEGNQAESLRILDQYTMTSKRQSDKKPRSRTRYNDFISKILNDLKETTPHISPPERMKIAVSRWHTQEASL